MANQTSVVIFDSTTRKQYPIAAGDKLAKAILDLTPGALSFNPATGVLSVTHADGATSTANLGVASPDKFLSGATYDSGTAVLTLTLSDASVINVPLGDLVAIVTSNAGNVKFTGTGASATPLQGNLDLATTTAPTQTDDGSTPTVFFGGNASALGTPVGWATLLVNGTARKVAYY
jgi:hypothetical protein